MKDEPIDLKVKDDVSVPCAEVLKRSDAFLESQAFHLRRTPELAEPKTTTAEPSTLELSTGRASTVLSTDVIPEMNAAMDNGEMDNEEIDVPVFYGTNGQPVACTYVKHPEWNESANVCMTLHFIMLTIGPRRVSSWGYKYRLAIQYFMDFLADYHLRHPRALHVTHIRDINPSIQQAFSIFLDRIGKTRKHAGVLKSSISLGAKQSSAVPELVLPAIRATKSSETEPLSEEGVASLTLATRKNIEIIRQTIERRKLIDAVQPYTYEELKDHFHLRLSKEDVLTWVKHHIENRINMPLNKVMIRVSKCTDPEITNLSSDPKILKKLREMVAADPSITIPENYVTNIRKMPSWQSTVLDPHRVVKTFIEHGFPFKFTIDEIRTNYSGQGCRAIENCDDAIKLILNKLYENRAGFNRFYGKQGQYMLSLDEHLALYYPTITNMAGLATLMMLQAGWNKETIMDVDKDNFEHPLTSTIEESIKIVHAEKFRGQGLMVPYDQPKQILAASDADNPYSLYNLILLAKEFTAPLAPFINGVIDPIRNRQVNTLFAYVRPWSGWALSQSSTGLATLDYSTQFSIGVSEFLKTYEVTDNGKRLTSSSEITRRLRVSWLFYNAESNPFAFLSQLLGHQSRDTTDKSYDNSPQARARRMKRLRSVLEHIVELLRARKFKGLLGKRARQLAKTQLSIFFLPHLERPLWACGNRYKPDWPGAPELPKGVKCNALEQCLFCSRVWILEESLPYLIERLAHLDELLRDSSSAEFGSRYESEQEQISAILDEWPDLDALQEALQYRTENTPLLPRNLRDLRLIFKTGDLDE
ncbi:hypothetical protein [Pseudomonas putida]|uniref:hypothetical protein n=1 Tax=Pseudomonas putida TaxID=303 RepID=UPI000A10CC3F|nr:hypothetical protein [Pseudomonas putida]ORL48576.1 hypothetical protein B7H18_26325 [Pseudomonas putida]